MFRYAPFLLTLTLITVLHAGSSIKHSLPVYQEHNATLMADGNRSTFFWTARGIQKNETITFHIPKPIPAGKTIIVHDGKPDGKDKFSGAIIETSNDGTTWTSVGNRRAGVLSATLTKPARHFRLRASHNTNHWIAIREIQLTDQSPIKITRKTINHRGKRITLSLATNLDGFDQLSANFDQMTKTYFKTWPRLVEMLGSPINDTHRDVDIIFNREINHPAHASGNTITISSKHLQRDPADTIGVFIHELTHVIQRYRGPAWFVEGVADYTRFKLHQNDRWAQRCRRHAPHDRPFGQYWASAAFLLYLEETYQKPIVRTVSMAMRARKYDESIWKNLTGKPLQTLAEEYKKSGWKPKSYTSEKK